MRRIAVIVAIVLPLAGAVVLERYRPHAGAERAFIFLAALAIAVTLAILIGRGNDYPPSVAELAAASPEVDATAGCVWPAFLAMLFVAGGFLLFVITICGPRF